MGQSEAPRSLWGTTESGGGGATAARSRVSAQSRRARAARGPDRAGAWPRSHRPGRRGGAGVFCGVDEEHVDPLLARFMGAGLRELA